MKQTIKKNLFLLLTVLFVGTGLAFADGLVKLGDVNNDGEVSIADVTLLVNYLHDSSTALANPMAADANSDNVIDVADVTAIKNIIHYGTPDGSTTSVIFFTDVTDRDNPTLNKNYGDAPFLLNIGSAGSSATITYVSSNTSVATVATDGTVTIVGTGTTNITATLPAGDGFTGNSATLALTVGKKVLTGTETIVVSFGEAVYNGGAAVEPTVSVTLDGNPIDVNNEFDISYSNNTNAGTGTVTLTPKSTGNYGFSTITENFTITAVAATVTTPPTGASLTYNGSAQQLFVTTGAAATNGTLNYSKSQNSGYTADATSITETNAGTYTVWYKAVASDGNHSDSEPQSIEVTIAKYDIANATAATAIADQQYAGAQLTPAAPAIKMDETTIDASNYDVTYGANNAVGTGSVIYTAKSGSTNFTGTLTVNFTITSGTLSVTANDYNSPYDGSAHGITVTCDGATIKYGETEGSYTLDASPTLTDVGNMTVFYQVTKDNYTTVTGSKTITISQKSVTVSGITANSKTYDGTTAATLVYTGATFTGIVAGDNLSVIATGAFADANAGEGKTVNISELTLGGSSAANYVLAGEGQQETATADINKATYTIAGTATATAAYGAQVKNIPISGLTVKDISSNTVAGSWAFSSEEVPSVGNATAYTATFTPSAADANYNTLTQEITPTITAAAASVTTAPVGKAGLTYNGSAQVLVNDASASYTGGTLVYCKTADGVYGAANTITETAAGTYSFYYKVQGDANHTDTNPVQVTGVSIGKATLTATANDQSRAYGVANPELTVTVTGFVNSETESVISTMPIATTEATTSSAVGTYDITVSGGAATNYDFSYTKGTLTISKAAPTYTAPVFSALTYTGAAQNLVSAGTSEQGTFTYSTSQNGTYSADIPQGTNAGNYTVWYKFTGNANYEDIAASEVTGVSISPAAFSDVTIADVSAQTFTGSTITPTPAVTLGSNAIAADANTFAYSYESNTNAGSSAKVILTPAASGNFTGDAREVTFTINPAAATITADATQSTTYSGSPQAPTASVTAGGVTITYYTDEGHSAGETTTTPTNAGTYYAVVSQSNANYTSTSVDVTFTINKAVLTSPRSSLSDAVVGDVIDSDGNAWGVDNNHCMPNDKTGIALVTYVGATENSTYNHGLALALTDANDSNANSEGKYQWKTSASVIDNGGVRFTPTGNKDPEDGLTYFAGTLNHNNSDYPAFKAAFDYGNSVPAPTTTGTIGVNRTSHWFLASAYQWELMINATGGYSALRTAFEKVGGTNMRAQQYWSSSEAIDPNNDKSYNNALTYRFSSTLTGWKGLTKTVYWNVRPVLAF